MQNVPDHETVKKIMNDVYNGFYLKWRNDLTPENADAMMQDVYELEQKYPYDLCRSCLIHFMECFDEEYRKRRSCLFKEEVQ